MSVTSDLFIEFYILRKILMHLHKNLTLPNESLDKSKNDLFHFQPNFYSKEAPFHRESSKILKQGKRET